MTPPPKKSKKLILFGDSAFAQIAYEYFTWDSPYEVVAFTVSKDFLEHKEMCGLPVVPFEEVQKLYPPSQHEMHVALVYMKLNAIRARFYEEAKAKGYQLANFVSPRAFLWRNVELGDNCFIFENNVIQPFVKIGSNVVLWSGNHIGHHSTIGSHTFVASHAVVSGFVEIGEACFLGVNCAFANNIKVGKRSLIGAGALVVKSIPDESLVKGTPSPVEQMADAGPLSFLKPKAPKT